MTIKLTEAAATEAKVYLEDSKEKYLRIGVKGGGCSGFEYSLTVSHEYDEQKDSLSHQHGVDVIVDRKSALYLDGTTVDYYNDIARRGFTFEKGSNFLMVEDVVTTGLSSIEAIKVVTELGGNVVGEAAIIDRSGGDVNLGIDLITLLSFNIPTFDEDNIPDDLKQIKPIKPGSRSL